MERVTITIDDDLLADLDGFIGRKGYSNRSEAIRDAVRQMLADDRLAEEEQAECVGCVVYLYNHHERELSSRLIEAQHRHHEIPTATLHLHIDADTCLEATVLHGPVGEVRSLADRITSQNGVRHGNLHVIPLETSHKHD